MNIYITLPIYGFEKGLAPEVSKKPPYARVQTNTYINTTDGFAVEIENAYIYGRGKTF